MYKIIAFNLDNKTYVDKRGIHKIKKMKSFLKRLFKNLPNQWNIWRQNDNFTDR